MNAMKLAVAVAVRYVPGIFVTFGKTSRQFIANGATLD
jgi:hypothetical protein